MAKATTKVQGAAAAAGTSASPFSIMEDSAPPAPARFGGGRSADDNPYRQAALALGAPVGGKFFAFQVPVTVADTITDPAEKAKAIKEASKKLLNAIGGVTRRLSKNDANLQYTVRAVDATIDGKSVPVIKVWRVAPKAPTA